MSSSTKNALAQALLCLEVLTKIAVGKEGLFDHCQNDEAHQNEKALDVIRDLAWIGIQVTAEEWS